MSGTDLYKYVERERCHQQITVLYTFINVRNLCFPVFCFDGRTNVFMREMFVAMNK